jgi:SRSO17 transposase
MLHRGDEQWHGAEPTSSLWEGRKSAETIRRIPLCSRGTSCPWSTAPLGPYSSALSDLSGSGLRLQSQPRPQKARNFATMARNMTGDDGQALQHFMANSPWSRPAVFGPMQAEIKATPALAQGSTLILDESADEKAGTYKAGAARQYNGRLGKGDVCRVDTCLTYANGGLWAMVDGEHFLPAEWCGAAFAETRHALGIPPERTFETKIALGLKRVKRVKAHGVPCDLVACDALYGRDRPCRRFGR